MNNKPIKPTVFKSLQNLRSSSGLVSLKFNNSFCDKIFEKNKIASIIDEPVHCGDSKNLVYDTSRSTRFNSEIFETIIDLLLQLRAAQDDQNIIVQNNTVLREQILNQLKNEIFRISHKLTKKQLKDLEVVSSDSFDSKSLTDILNSFLESSKKKFKENNSLADNIFLKNRIFNINLEKTFANYRKIIGEVSLHESIRSPLVLKKNFNQDLTLSEASKKVKPKEKSLLRDSSEEIYHEILEDTSIRKLIKKDRRFLKSINHIYENSIVNKSGIILPIIKLHSRISEVKILNKAKLLVERVLNKTVYKSLPSEQELINKIIVKTQVNELRENVTHYQEQYLNEQARRKREIKNLYVEVKKLHSSKIISQNFTDLFKNNKLITFNIENLVKKNLNKLIFKNIRLSKFKNISENSIQNFSHNKNISRNKILNKTLLYKTSKDENKAIYDKVDLTKNIIEINRSFLSNIQKKNITVEEIRNKLKEYGLLVKPNSVNKINFKTISENSIRNFSHNKNISRNKILNKTLLYKTSKDENKAIYDKVDLTKNIIEINRSFLSNIQKKNVTVEEIRNKLKEYGLLVKPNSVNKINFKTISENVFENFPYNEKTSVYKIKNENLFYHNKENKIKEIEQKTNLNLNKLNIDNNIIKDIHENNIFIKEFRNKYTNYKALLKHNNEIDKESFQRYRLQKIYVNLNSQNVREYLNLDTKDHIYTYKKLYSEVTKNLNSQNNLKFYDTAKLNKIKFLIKEKVDYDFISHNENLIINKLNKELVRKIKEKITYTYVDRFKYLEHRDENLNNVSVFQRFVSKNSKKVLNQFQLFKSLKDIHYAQKRNMALNNHKKFIEDLKIFYHPEKSDIKKLVSHENFRMTKIFRIDKPKEKYVDTSHIVYKENVQLPKEDLKETVKEKTLKVKEEPDIIVKEKPGFFAPPKLDTKEIEQCVKANTLGKKEIENLIKSYINDIDIESISKIVISKIERKFAIDKRRSGIF